MQRSDFLRMIVLGGGSLALAPTWLPGQETPVITAGETELNAHFVNSGPGFGNRIALTYDDGPTPGVTDRILADLSKRNLRATFFMIGKKAEAYRSLAKEVADAGHEIANHTYTHPALNRLAQDRVEYEIRKAQDVLAEVTGREPAWFRPPYGAFRTNQGPIPRAVSLGVALWSVDPRDWAKPGASSIVQRVVSTTRAGSIVLLHDLHSQTADANPGLLDQLVDRNFNFTPLSAFLGAPYGEFYQPRRNPAS